MAINYPGPYELRIGYLPTIGGAQNIPHTQRLNVDLEGTPAQGSTFPNMNFNDINGATGISLDTLVEAYLAKFNALMRNDCDIVSVDLWKYPVAQSFDAVFWSTYTPTANVGTNAGTAQSAGQDIFTFRSQEGGIMKLSLMESVRSPGPPVAYAGLIAASQDIVDFVLDGDGATFSAPFLARDTSYPFAFIREYPGTNEKLWKLRNGR